MSKQNILAKLDKFVIELNERLPRHLDVKYTYSSSMDNVVNIIIGHINGGITFALFALVEDKDGTVYWCENITGRGY